MAPLFQTRCRVEFCHTDMVGIVHFTSFFAFMEAAEHAFLRHLGLNVFMEVDGQQISWPRVAAACDYHAPARFEDQLDIGVSVSEMAQRSVSYEFAIERDGTRLATGRMTCVCCHVRPGEPPRSIPIPELIARKLRGAMEGP
ncbi:MAG: acyl-CoA thioesterase [Pirellulales bacterium]